MKKDSPFESYYESSQLKRKGTYNIGIENGETVTYGPCLLRSQRR
jgi:antitoxin component YwqK of YwqJK toxin-antitoxin module